MTEWTMGRCRWMLPCIAALCATPASASAFGFIVECEKYDWNVKVSGASTDRELAARLIAAALDASGQASSVTVVDEIVAGDPAKKRLCQGAARVEVNRDQSRVAVDVALRRETGSEERGSGVAPGLVSALEDALVAAHLLPATPLVGLLPPPPCAPSRSPVAHALLVGINDYAGEAIPDLHGAVRDVSLVESSIKARYPSASVTKLLDRMATGGGLRRALTNLVEEGQCGDLAFIHYSGHASVGSDAVAGGDPRDMGRMTLVLSDGGRFGESILRGFVTALRNRGVLTIVLLDTQHAGGVNLGTAWQRSTVSEVELIRGAGDCAVMTAGKVAYEITLPEGTAGIFSLASALALRKEGGLTARSLASAIDGEIIQFRNRFPETPFFEASNPDAPILPGASGSDSAVLAVRLDGEQDTQRGITPEIALPSQGRIFVLAGTVATPGRLSALLVNGVSASLAPDSRFRVELELAAGVQKIQFVGVHQDLSLATTAREVRVGPETDLVQGRSYALLIGIQQYDKWSPLETPLGDVREVGRVLRDRYGFATSLASFGDLVLENPDKVRIGSAFVALRRALGPSDSLLVYYAGHGKAEGTKERRRGFWIPRDADQENRATWYSGQDLLNEIADLRARHVLVVSDSCFSGDLTRDKPNPPADVSEAERRRLLVERAARTSRILITSGYDEPVLDQGGSGHSVFARALIDGLERIQDERFLSFDLFSRFIYQQVGGKSPQQPHHLFLVDSGHDGGDMPFVRSAGVQK